MENIKAKIQGILMNSSQKSVIGWAVEEDDFGAVAEEIVKKLTVHCVVVNESNISDDKKQDSETEQLANFCKKISKQEDCPAEFQEIVNKEFWNLIG